MFMKAKKYLIAMAVICFFHLFSFSFMAGSADAAAKIQWSKAKKGSYNNLSPYTLNWSGDVLSMGGYSLAAMDVTASSKEADFVITQSGYIAANGIIKVNEQLEDMTDASVSNFNTYANVAQGAVYLIITHDDTWAKIKIDTVVKSYMDYISKVTFSYVTEEQVIEDKPAGGPQPNMDWKPGQYAEDVEKGLYDDNPFADPQYDLRYPGDEYTFEEGPVTISFSALKSQIAFDLYRSDNGGPYVPVSDFILDEPEYTDYYAFANHSYLYIFVAYDKYGLSEIALPIKVNIVPAGAANSTLGNKKITMKLESTAALVDGKKVTLDVAPVIVNGRTLVPVRFISEALGAEVGWDGASRTVTIALGKKEITLQLDSSTAIVNGKKVVMDVPAMTMKGRTMVPIRFVSESLDLAVEFNNSTREITIMSQSDSPAPSAEQDAAMDHYLNDLVGVWEMWIPSADPQVPGASGGILAIYDDLTWENYFNNKETTGEIAINEDGEVILLNYMFNWDWYVTSTKDGIKISSPPAAYQTGTPVEFE